MPEWVTHSTVTGGATALGLDAQRRVDNSSAAAMARGSANGLNGDADEHDYYGNMDGSDDEEDDDMEDSKPAVSSAFEGGVKEETEEERDGEDGYTDDGYTPMPSAPGTPVVNGASGGDAVMVMGEPSHPGYRQRAHVQLPVWRSRSRRSRTRTRMTS